MNAFIDGNKRIGLSVADGKMGMRICTVGSWNAKNKRNHG
jgi:hypothetical protein